MSSSQAGPSSASAHAQPEEVNLSVEPVHIYTDAASAVAQRFERENKLNDITADGTNIFASRKPASVQLSDDVRRLWAERGDFSQFRSSELRVKRSRQEAISDVEGDTNSSISSNDDDEEEGNERRKEEGEGEGEEGLLRKEGEVVGGTITESDFVKLRNQVLGSLDVAHFNSIHAHQLVGMLIKQHRSNASALNNANATAAGRMGSPAPSVGAASNRSGPTTLAAKPQAPLGIFGHLTHANSSREEEFILDPLAIALSKTSLNTSTAVRRDLSTDGDDDDEEGGGDDDDEVLQDPTSVEYGLRQARREIEATEVYKENKLREFKVVLETKRQAIGNAAELLASAAAELRKGHAGNRERWRSLIGLHGRGWGLTPGRPLLDVERFGVGNDDENENEQAEKEKTAEEKTADKKKVKKPAGLQGFGTPILTSDGKIKDEGARDAWIGFGLPEAPLELRRRSIAYWANTSSLPADADTKAKLVFPDRMYRRLRVRFVLWPSTSGAAEARIEWTSDAPSTPAAAENKVAAGQILDTELQDASREASDELVFGDVVAQARMLPPSFGVRLTSSSVRIVLTKRLDLVVELVPTSSTEDDAKAGGEGKERENEQQARYAAHASLLLAFLRLGPLRKYQAFVAATAKGRQSDAAARAAAIKAAALAVPKKSTSAQSAAQKDAGAGGGGGKGIGAGGRASSLALAKLDTLGPVMVSLHYWSFVHRLGTLLQQVQRDTEARAEAEGKSLKVKIELLPVTPSQEQGGGVRAVDSLMRVLGSMVDATRSSALLSQKTSGGGGGRSGVGDGGAGSHTFGNKLDVLRGHAKVWVLDGRTHGAKLICTLSFAQPSLLSVQFAPTTAPTKLTTKPLAVDLDTLGSLLSQQMAHST